MLDRAFQVQPLDGLSDPLFIAKRSATNDVFSDGGQFYVGLWFML
ncbi:hypothetical protein [Gimesia fumaroli]|uniref:Uncharacterized protein n=1 Tax=Gimesia fumaroli TaxID=2527976 RepID=A0A518IE28_9PLAN|nr:hypothetical protein [Gimesia fumaroli]QDV51354.1 hypothetical protein Enr17x_34100 [Gimesia fumaroli]